MNGSQSTKSLPVFGGGNTPPDAAGSAGKDSRGFRDIVKVFIRTWPFLRPHVFGYWRELSRRDSSGTDERVNAHPDEVSTEDGWSFQHVPPIVTVLAMIGPLVGWLPFGTHWTLDLLVVATGVMTALTWVLLFVKGRAYVGVSFALVLIGVAAALFAVFAVRGLLDNLQVGLVCLGCACIWVLQYKQEGGRIRFRVRLGSHLIYYFMLSWATTLLAMVIALFSVDLISQSILQAEPLTPFLADFIGEPELAVGSTDVPSPETEGTAAGEPNFDQALLSSEQRHSLKWLYVVLLVVAWLTAIPTSLVLPYYYIFIMQRINQDLRMALVERWHSLSLRYHGDHRVGDSVYRIYQDSAQVTAVIGAAMKVMQSINAYAIAIIFLAALDPILGLMALSVLLLAVVWGRWFSPRMRRMSLAARETNSSLTSRIQETFAAIRVVKAYGAGAVERERLDQDSVTAFNMAYQIRSLVAVVGIITFTLASAVLLGGELLMAVWASSGRETFATALVGMVGLSFVAWNLSAFQYSQTQFGMANLQVGALVQKWAEAQDMAMGLDRVFEILDIEPDIEDDPDAVPMPSFSREIRFDTVGFAYESDRPILHDISFTVKPGTITAIVGPTGSGKSTLMSLLSRLYDPDSGSISIDGIDLRKLKIDSLRDNVSIALQENVLFGMSVRDNIRYVLPDADDAQVLQAAEVACADEYIAGLPEGLDTMLGDRGGKLSSGQRQRLSIARAVIKDAPILILDEPTAALDAYTEHRVLERLVAWSDGRAIFLITHRISTIKSADQILYLDQGAIIERGSHTELMKQEGGRYRNFVETEAKLSKRPHNPKQPNDGGE